MALSFFAILAGLMACRRYDEHQDYSLPSFLDYSTDLPDLAEGTAQSPLQLRAPPRCPYQPSAGWQDPICAPGSNPPTVYSAANSYRTSTSPFRWRIVVNNEWSWETANPGPPNQSLPWNNGIVQVVPQVDAITLGLTLASKTANLSKIPYVAVTYIRGVQGEASAICPWGRKPQLQFYVQLNHSVGRDFAQRLHLWLHFKDPNGGDTGRYMPHVALWDEGQYQDFVLEWNWPAIHSYYYPGANMIGGPHIASMPELRIKDVPTPQLVVVDVEKMALARFPQLATLRPDFQGFEIAVEGAYLNYANPPGDANNLSVTISDPRLVFNQ